MKIIQTMKSAAILLVFTGLAFCLTSCAVYATEGNEGHRGWNRNHTTEQNHQKPNHEKRNHEKGNRENHDDDRR